MAEIDIKNLKAIFEETYLPGRDEAWMEWRQNYLNFITEVKLAKKDEFYEPAFQKRLWDDNSITGIGPGTAFSVESAYSDQNVIRELWDLRNLTFTESALERSRILQSTYNRLIETVAKNHSPSGKYPWARLIRVFAALRPDEVMCIVSTPWLKTLHRALGKKTGPYKRIMIPHVSTLGFLFAELDLERDLSNTVDVNQFAWWLATQQQELQDESVGVSSQTTEFKTATDRPSLSILPYEAQRKGLFYVTDNIPLLHTIVEAASDGAMREELRELVLSTNPNLKASSANNVLNQAKALGLLRLENHIYYLTPLGEELRDGEPPHQVLLPNMVRRFFGFAHMLAFVRDENWSISKAVLLERMRFVYPSWTTDFMPNQLTTWMVKLGLFEYGRDENNARAVIATDDGQYWASGLPEDMSPWHVETVEEDDEAGIESIVTVVPVSPTTTFDPPNFTALLTHFEAENLILPAGFLQRLHSALHTLNTKRFVLLTGLSGTGKTSIARAYAAAYCKALEITGKHYCEIPVWPDWTDPTGLLGFVNPLHAEPTYQTTEALTFLRRASQNPGKPFFLCLDEMNLARVEHYFAPLLSAMEGKPGSQVLKLHSFEGQIENVEPEIPWPRNLFIFGTVNMDETTHPFSDKVLDRAFSFELWEVDREAWLKAKIRDDAISRDQVNLVFPILSALYEALFPVRRHFGYRVFDEVLQFCIAWPNDNDFAQSMDAAVYAKILPKIRGEDTDAFSTALSAVEAICTENDLKQCTERLKAMHEDLSNTGFVRFWS